MGSFIRRQLAPLERLAKALNDPIPHTYAPELRGAQPDDEPRVHAAVAAAQQIIREVSRRRPAEDPPHTVWQAWEALCLDNPFIFWATGAGFLSGGPPALDLSNPGTWQVYISRGQLAERGRRWAGGAWLRMRTPFRSGVVVALLGEYLNSLYRDRLKQCPQCQRWFVDQSRNKSSLRCSRACTIAWSNRQRPMKGARR